MIYDSNTSSMPLLLLIAFAFKSVFWKSKTKVVKILNPLNSDNKCISLFLIVDSVSLSCNSGLKEFKVTI